MSIYIAIRHTDVLMVSNGVPVHSVGNSSLPTIPSGKTFSGVPLSIQSPRGGFKLIQISGFKNPKQARFVNSSDAKLKTPATSPFTGDGSDQIDDEIEISNISLLDNNDLINGEGGGFQLEQPVYEQPSQINNYYEANNNYGDNSNDTPITPVPIVSPTVPSTPVKVSVEDKKIEFKHIAIIAGCVLGAILVIKIIAN